MKKVQLTLTDHEAEILNATAQKYGYRLQRYLKFIISKEVAHNIDETATYLAQAKQELKDKTNNEYMRELLKNYDPLDLQE